MPSVRVPAPEWARSRDLELDDVGPLQTAVMVATDEMTKYSTVAAAAARAGVATATADAG
jgi:hypothetical protein